MTATWTRAWIGYASFAIVSVVANAFRALSEVNIVREPVLLLLAFVVGPLFFGIFWFWLGSRVLGGLITVGDALRLAGAALFPPCVLALSVMAVVGVFYALGMSWKTAALLLAITRLVAGVASYAAFVTAATHANGFGPGRVAVFVFWPIVFFGVLLVGFAVLFG